ncbi:hypothetical protein ACUTAH_02830 [Metapseudomonas furukawaii]|uniref:hypothetical protein n=1 Tax=Metapseudomonas furukawaii TaxID=1149133 RepID=UPI0040466DD7
MSQPCQGGETQAGASQSDLNQDQKLELIERQLKVLLDEVHELREDMAIPSEPDHDDTPSS